MFKSNRLSRNETQLCMAELRDGAEREPPKKKPNTLEFVKKQSFNLTRSYMILLQTKPVATGKHAIIFRRWDLNRAIESG